MTLRSGKRPKHVPKRTMDVIYCTIVSCFPTAWPTVDNMVEPLLQWIRPASRASGEVQHTKRMLNEVVQQHSDTRDLDSVLLAISRSALAGVNFSQWPICLVPSIVGFDRASRVPEQLGTISAGALYDESLYSNGIAHWIAYITQHGGLTLVRTLVVHSSIAHAPDI